MIDDDMVLAELFGAENLNVFCKQFELLDLKRESIIELADLRKRASEVFKFNLTLADLTVSASAGILLGLANALFKDFVPEGGPFKHVHKTRRTAIDYKVPKQVGSDLHRQIGPSHDVFRFKETLRLITGEQADFKLWGSTVTKILGHGNPAAEMLRSHGMSVDGFKKIGGFRIPDNPKAELLHHLLIDFFTKRSLPVPGTTFIADHFSRRSFPIFGKKNTIGEPSKLAKTMIMMYDKEFNLKTLSGNLMGFTLLQLIIHSYAFLFKALPNSGILESGFSEQTMKNLMNENKQYKKSNDFNGMMMIAHGASFTVDTIISSGGKGHAALLQLNYASLVMFVKHLLSYIIKNSKQYSELMKQVKDKSFEIGELNHQWYISYKERFFDAANDPDFIRFIDSETILDSHNRVIEFAHEREALNDRKKKALLMLKGYNDE